MADIFIQAGQSLPTYRVVDELDKAQLSLSKCKSVIGKQMSETKKSVFSSSEEVSAGQKNIGWALLAFAAISLTTRTVSTFAVREPHKSIFDMVSKGSEQASPIYSQFGNAKVELDRNRVTTKRDGDLPAIRDIISNLGQAVQTQEGNVSKVLDSLSKQFSVIRGG